MQDTIDLLENHLEVAYNRLVNHGFFTGIDDPYEPPSSCELALLASYSEDELATGYHYFRSFGYGESISTIRDNLIVAFEKELTIESSSPLFNRISKMPIRLKTSSGLSSHSFTLAKAFTMMT
ncbi:hypothetical protein Ahy_B06g081956 isoform B [Arachis hypogaea]|uniref:DNA/RNA-binding domain-containing protein n=1 Tax=Arachis hypogaea TaxID=3818 RepID=A0A444YME4_ARAHY|nr:hypothetical protein Ahy_B06g081956 isoform B [Arachis hypogaea]